MGTDALTQTTFALAGQHGRPLLLHHEGVSWCCLPLDVPCLSDPCPGTAVTAGGCPEQEEEETDELLLLDEEMLDAPPEDLPRRLLTNFAVYNAEVGAWDLDWQDHEGPCLLSSLAHADMSLCGACEALRIPLGFTDAMRFC